MINARIPTAIVASPDVKAILKRVKKPSGNAKAVAQVVLDVSCLPITQPRPHQVRTDKMWVAHQVLVQLVEQDLQSTSVQNMLFRISEDPYEYNDLASQHPDLVTDLSERIYEWRSQYPINGTRVHLMPPPGWRAPKDWASYPTPARELQEEPAPGYPPDAFKLRALDWIHRGRGRLIYE